MTRNRRIATVATVLALAAPTSAATGDPGVGGFMSPNVRWQGTIPVDLPGIGAKVVQVGAQRRLYVTGLRGLTIYDVTIPMVPVPMGHLELPHFENEDVAVSDDGSRVVIAADLPPQVVVVDTSLPAAPRIAGRLDLQAHTSTCADPACDALYTSYGKIVDLRDPNAPKVAGEWSDGAHAAFRDEAGYVIDSGLRMYDPRPDPFRPRLLVRSPPYSGWGNPSFGHNDVRPDAGKWRPRRRGDNSPALRPGELVLSGGESLLRTDCQRESGITTWSMANWDRGKTFRPLDSFFPENGDWVDGNPAANGLGCSSHWFDYRKGVVAAGWYEHGVRFFDVHRKTGKITQAGWFQPVATEAWAAYWIDDEYVYSLDAARGIDVLRFDRDAPRPARTQSERSWSLDPDRPVTFATRRERSVCAVVERALRP